MNILILAAGGDNPGSGNYPLCLSEINGTPLIQIIIESCQSLDANLIVAFLGKEAEQKHLDRVIKVIRPDTNLVYVNGKTKGAACTALLAISHIDNDEELLILNVNEIVDVDFLKVVEGFRQRKLDAGAIIFEAVHPRYSYVLLDENGLMIQASEKTPISNNATTGFYWFAKGSEFVAATKKMISYDMHVDGNFYICPVFNEYILDHRSVGIHRIDSANYHPFKTKAQLADIESHLGKRNTQ